MNLESLKMVENINLDDYINERDLIKINMEYPEWLGDFEKEDLEYELKHGAKIWMFYDDDKFVCSMMIIPSTEKVLKKFDIDYEYTTVIDYGPMFVNPKYVGNGLQLQMLEYEDNYAKNNGYMFSLVTIHPENKYSINNILKDGFEYRCQKELSRGIRNIYIKKL